MLAFVPRSTSYRSVQESLPFGVRQKFEIVGENFMLLQTALNCGLVNWCEFPTGIETDKFSVNSDLNVIATKMIYVYRGDSENVTIGIHFFIFM